MSYNKFVIDDASTPRSIRVAMYHYTTWPKHEARGFYECIPVLAADGTASTLGRAFLKT